MSNIENNVSRHEFDLYRPDGSVGIVKVKIGNDRSPTANEEMSQHFASIDPSSLTDGLEKEITRLEERLTDLTGYTREGTPIMRLTGRDRERVEFALGNRRNALAQAKVARVHAERVQAEARKTQAASLERIEAAAQAQAQKLIEQAEIDRRARQIAAKAGVTSR